MKQLRLFPANQSQTSLKALHTLSMIHDFIWLEGDLGGFALRQACWGLFCRLILQQGMILGTGVETQAEQTETGEGG